jgi:hypothetical protein
MIQGLIFINLKKKIWGVKKCIFWALNRTVRIPRAKFRPKIILICQNRTSWQACIDQQDVGML